MRKPRRLPLTPAPMSLKPRVLTLSGSPKRWMLTLTLTSPL